MAPLSASPSLQIRAAMRVLKLAESAGYPVRVASSAALWVCVRRQMVHETVKDSFECQEEVVCLLECQFTECSCAFNKMERRGWVGELE